ncbi:MAG TPA: hypothetical protein VL171_15615 [Verrucomicrobiae bacterium]|nr:hypothetical protein [Verrucomicrobiae bacterium]
MPLLANLGSNGLEPCAISPPEIATNIFYRGNEGNNLDTYSVLASFGAKFAAKGSSTAGPEASGGLAQFFATGLAARKLAQVGGAQLVSVQPSDAEAAAYAALTDTDLLHDQGVLDGLLKKKLKAGTTLDGKTFSPDETQDYADALAAKKKMTLMTIRRKGGRDLKDINENLANATE